MGKLDITVAVTEQDGDIRLDRWFKRHYPALPHGMLQRFLREKKIRVDGARASADQRLKEGDILSFPPLLSKAASSEAKKAPRPVTDEQARRLQEMILYRDDDMFVLNKPAGLAVQGGTKVKEHIDHLISALQGSSPTPPKLVHRLDKETSGVLVLARTPKAAAFLTDLFASREVEKVYWAVVEGCPNPPEGKITAPLLKTGERVVVDENGQKAVTLYRVIDSLANAKAWVELRPLTGRTHQLRVHMLYAGHPIMGDQKYHPNPENNSLHLHAREIKMPKYHGGAIHVTAPLPPHMRETFAFYGFDERNASS